MFFVTIKFNRRTAVSIILAVAAILIALIILFSSDSEAVLKSNKLETREGRVEYLSRLGWEVEAESESHKKVLIPQQFTGVYEEYNSLQKQQGFDLEKYKGTELEMYSYIVTNYNSSETVVATIYLKNGNMVGGDIHSTTLDGFMHGLK